MGLDVVYILTNMREEDGNSRAEPENKNEKPVGHDQLIPGYEFPVASYILDSQLILRYVEAVGGHYQPELVPPLAIVAYALTALSKSMTLPPGSIHAAQEVESFRPVPVGSIINCRARVAQRFSRGRVNLLAIELDGLNQSGERVISGKTTLILPG